MGGYLIGMALPGEALQEGQKYARWPQGKRKLKELRGVTGYSMAKELPQII